MGFDILRKATRLGMPSTLCPAQALTPQCQTAPLPTWMLFLHCLSSDTPHQAASPWRHHLLFGLKHPSLDCLLTCMKTILLPLGLLHPMPRSLFPSWTPLFTLLGSDTPCQALPLHVCLPRSAQPLTPCFRLPLYCMDVLFTLLSTCRPV